MTGTILAAGVDGRELRLEVRFLQRQPELLREAGSATDVIAAIECEPPGLVVLGGELVTPALVRFIRAKETGRQLSLLAIVPAGEPPGTEGLLLEAGANAALRRPLDRFVLESWIGKLLDVPQPRAAADPRPRAGRGQPAQGERGALLRPHPQPERARHAARQPRADRRRGSRPRARSARARGTHARARTHRARCARGGLALHRLRDRVPVPARRGPARDRSHGAARCRSGVGASALEPGRDPLDLAARRAGSTRSRSPRAPRAVSWSRSAAARDGTGGRAARRRSTWSRRRTPARRSPPPAPSCAATAEPLPRRLRAAAGARRRRAGSTSASTRSPPDARAPTRSLAVDDGSRDGSGERLLAPRPARPAAAGAAHARARPERRRSASRSPRRARRSSRAWTPTTSPAPRGWRGRSSGSSATRAWTSWAAASAATAEPGRRPGPGMQAYVGVDATRSSTTTRSRASASSSPRSSHPSVAMRSDALRRLGGWRDFDGPEDYDLWLRAFDAGLRFAKLPGGAARLARLAGRLTRTDPRYSPGAASWRRSSTPSRAGPLAGRRRSCWGAGPIGKRWARALVARGFSRAPSSRSNPRKLGSRIHGAPVGARRRGRRVAGALHLAAVGQQGRPPAHSPRGRPLGLADGRDLFAVA